MTENATAAATNLHDLFVGRGEMATLMREHDWAATPLGPADKWPTSLKVAIRLLLTSRFDMWLGWGPDIAFFYNDAYRPTLGNKHPQSLGTPTQELWAEIWPDIEPRIRSVYERGEATWDKALLLLLNRHGYPEETYHTFSYSPLIGDTGRVEGLFCAVTEDTERVISERRLGSLRTLASGLNAAENRLAVLAAAQQALSGNTHDLPFMLTYLFHPGGQASLGFATGFEASHPLAPQGLPREGGVWELGGVWQGEVSTMLTTTGFAKLPPGAWDRPADQAVVVPIPGLGAERPLGAMVIGVNPYRAFDADYLAFVQLLAGQLAASLASAEVYEAERKRTQVSVEVLGRANERLSSEVRLRTQERDRLRTLFQQAPSFMCMLLGREHVVAFVNDAYLTLVGSREMVGLPIRQALPEIEGQGYFELLDQVFSTGQPYVGRNLAATLQRTPGAALEQRFLHLVYQPIFEPDGSVMGIFVDGFDVTDQKHAEDELQKLNETLEQRVHERTVALDDAMNRLKDESAQREAAQGALRQAQKMESLGALTGGIAHDFNNLLQVINGNIQLLAKDIAGNDRAEKRMHNAMAGVSRGAKLASQLLAFGRRQPLAPKVVNIGRFMKGMDDMLRRALGEEVEIETIISAGLWNTLVDPGQIENALLNLAINARDAMDGRGRLTIEAGNALLDETYAEKYADVEPGQYVMVAVTDTGSGIPAELIDRVFEPFFSTKPEGKGTGLGLSMVYGFVKQSGGHIKIYSEVGQGTTVRLYLRRAMENEDVLADIADLPVRGGTETVLVVEDDEQVRETAAAMLTDLGYRVLKARDADSALIVIESGLGIDLLFTDVVMPGHLRSPELARIARERLPDIGVLFTSGYTQNAIVHGGRLDPGVELLSKPYTREALARKVRHVLANQAQRALMARRLPQRVAVKPGPPSVNVTSRRSSTVVLLVEDEELIRTSVAELLREGGYVVLEMPDGEAALQVLSTQQPIDILLADVGLPGISGVELARQAVVARPSLGVVFVTGDAMLQAEKPVPDALVLVKPYDQEDVVRALTVLSRRRSPQHEGS